MDNDHRKNFVNEVTRYRPRYDQLAPSVSKVDFSKHSKRSEIVDQYGFDGIDKRVSKKSLLKLAQMAVNLPME